MGRLMEWLRRPIAGIPAWGWALVIAGTIAAYAYVQRLRADDDGPKVAPETLPYPDGQSPSDAGDVPGVPVVIPNDVTVTTNPAWVRVVTDRLVAAGRYSPVDVSNALNKVLSGLEVTAQEAAIFNEAVRLYGAPPEGNPPIVVIAPPVVVPPVVIPPKPVPKPVPKPPVAKPVPRPAPPPAYHSVRVVKYTTNNPPWNSTISGIAGHYGKSWPSVWNDAKNAALKRRRGVPERIQPGDIVYVRK